MVEYKVIRVQDESTGLPSAELIEQALNDHAKEGWRLAGITTNEIGRNSSSHGYGGISQSTNATIDVTVLILEREITNDDLAKREIEKKKLEEARVSQIPQREGYWTCPVCGKNNANYVGTCSCGLIRRT